MSSCARCHRYEVIALDRAGLDLSNNLFPDSSFVSRDENASESRREAHLSRKGAGDAETNPASPRPDRPSTAASGITAIDQEQVDLLNCFGI